LRTQFLDSTVENVVLVRIVRDAFFLATAPAIIFTMIDLITRIKQTKKSPGGGGGVRQRMSLREGEGVPSPPLKWRWRDRCAWHFFTILARLLHQQSWISQLTKALGTLPVSGDIHLQATVRIFLIVIERPISKDLSLCLGKSEEIFHPCNYLCWRRRLGEREEERDWQRCCVLWRIQNIIQQSWLGLFIHSYRISLASRLI